jgi:TonB family protein
LTLPVPAARPPSAAPKKAAPPVEAPRQPRQMADRADTAGLVRRPVATPDRTEPQPLRRVSPVLSREVLDERRNAKGDVTISVLVKIDGAGSVESAKVVSSAGESGSSGTHLRLAALNAAKQWKFHPATAGGKPIPSDLTLAFTF